MGKCIYNMAIIGCGYWGIKHLRVLQELSQCSACVVESNSDRLVLLRQQYPGVHVYENLLACVQNENIIAAVVATPAHTHYAIVSELLRRGVHVLCEKPLSRTGAEAREVYELARHNACLLMAGHLFLHQPGIRAMASLIHSGAIGEVRHIASWRSNLGPVRNDVNVLHDLLVHDISIINGLLGGLPKSVAVQGPSRFFTATTQR